MASKKGDEALATPEYWDDYYIKPDGDHEWFRTYKQLKPFLAQHLFNREGLQPKDNPLILHPGSGESEIPRLLAQEGYKRQLCFDFSDVAVKNMRKQLEEDPVEGMEYIFMNAFTMDKVSDKSVDVAFDKGMMDALIHGDPWNPPKDVRENTRKYQEQLHRVLKDDGVFLYITFRQRHFIEPLLMPKDLEPLWDLQMTALVGNDGSFGYFGWVIRKKGAPVRQLIEVPSETKPDNQEA
ncbi:hypothetical protein A9Z42_0022440 [Trichoderma parareesei]|uniref:Methyltransferase domain-containing protein n=1 Tax=Trichoderma parareesei TaxID=858221 RepID=A0A2H2ZEW9_TRIPA|nr:hypothetical protein A9Z42_0022440 [Trichoderma parareesei]